MIAAVLLLLFTGVLALVTAAIVGWQVTLAIVAGIIVIKLLKAYAFKK